MVNLIILPLFISLLSFISAFLGLFFFFFKFISFNKSVDVLLLGFDDALVSLDSLTKIEFDLPTDLAIRPFQNIRDAF